MTPPRIALSHITKRYGVATVVNAVSFSVPPGQFVALVGGSGSGKTTLLKTINRLVAPDSGQVSIDGQDVTGLSAPALRRQIGYAFQGIGLFPHMSVAENIAIVPRLLGQSVAERRARVDELLALVGLPADVAARSPDALSGGQRQRVGVARALAAQPRIMLMDEPFGALDPVTRDRLGSAYRGLHDQLGLTTLMVTHDMAEALLLADRILVVANGEVIADATPAGLVGVHDDPRVNALLDVPRRQAARIAALGGAA